MEQHIIPLNQGIHLTPSAAEDGQLGDCVNLITKDGALRNAPQLETITTTEGGQTQDITLANGHTLAYIHTTASSPHYITKSGQSLYLHPDTSTPILTLDTGVTMKQITSIGNTIVVLASDGMHYLLWKNDNSQNNSQYTSLGTHLPEIQMGFECVASSIPSTVTAEANTGYFHFTNLKIDDSYVKGVSDAIHGAINKAVAEEVSDKGFFAHPFFVRYAFRLYDGTTTMPSAPLLINKIYGENDDYQDFQITDPVCQYGQVDFDGNSGNSGAGARYSIDIKKGSLECYLSNQDIQTLQGWKDIISSIDIYVSAPLYLYDQSKDIKDLTVELDQTGTMARAHLTLPDYTDERMLDEIKHNGTFYLVHSILIEDADTYTIPDLSKKLPALTTREQLKDDYDSHDTLVPKFSFVYNQRLNIANIDKQIFGGFTPLQLNLKKIDGNDKIAFAVTYKINGKTIITRQSANNIRVIYPFYYYNPNANATTLNLVMEQSVEGGTLVSYRTVKLTQHNLLQGSYAIVDNLYWTISTDDYQTTCNSQLPAATLDNTIHLPNKIYTSEVNNPFFFPVSGINTIGTGEIKGICAAVKALSQGQFGQFPLYVFATDGIWALEVKDDGTYSVKQPVTRDVCKNPDSIAQTDSAVIYATERGLHILQGSETKILTQALEAYTETFDATGITIPSEWSSITANVLSATPLLTELADAHISYDGINHIVHIYPPLLASDGSPVTPTPTSHHILHLDSMEWTRTTQPIPSTFIDGYPNATLQIGQKLYQYALPSYDNSILQQGFLLTRETALGSPTTHKILKDMRTLKHWYSAASSNHKVRIIPLISNDRLHWYRLTSLHAHSAVWYRFAIFTLMADSDMLEALTLITEDRRTNKLR